MQIFQNKFLRWKFSLINYNYTSCTSGLNKGLLNKGLFFRLLELLYVYSLHLLLALEN